MKGKQGLRLMSWNCGRGFLKQHKKEEITDFLKNKGINICSISEVELNNINEYAIGLYNIPQYTAILPKSWEVHKKARIITYIKNDIKNKTKVREDLMTENQPDIWVEIQIGKGRTLLCGMIYREWTSIDRRDSHPDQLNRLKELLENAERATQENTEVILMGDLNVNVDIRERNGRNRELKALLQNFTQNNNFAQLVETHSRERVVGGKLQQSIIDHVYTNMPDYITGLSVTKTACSDHAIIHFTRKTSHMLQTTSTFEYRCLKHYHKDIFLEELGGMDWKDVLEEQDIDTALDKTTNILKSTLDRHAPLKKGSNQPAKSKSLSKKTKKKIEERNKLFRRYKRNKTQENLDEWTKAKKEVVGYLKQEQNLWEKEELSSPVKAWNFINNNKGPKAIRGGPPSILTINGKETTCSEQMAEHMNIFFINKIETNRAKIEEKRSKIAGHDILSEDIFAKDKAGGFEIKEVCESKIRSIIKNMKKSKVYGPDSISNKIIYDCRELIVRPITHIINLSIKEGYYPKAWKVAKIIALHKKGSKQLACNYRPIALLSRISLICEKVIHEQISNYFTENNIFHQNQHGYIKNKSCMTALLTIYDKWARAINEKKLVGVLCMDLTAAFDLVDKDILVEKLKLYGAGKKTLSWIRSYMSDRKQFVVINTIKSKTRYVRWGVPQGSKLGPLLFLIFVNDMMETVTNGSCEMYADDSAISVMGESTSEIKGKLEENVMKITKWLDKNCLMLAPEKSELMVVTNKRVSRQLDSFELNIEGKIIKQKDKIKLLGIKLDKTLSFNNHLNGEPGQDIGLIKSLSNRIWLIQRIRNSITENTCRMLVNGLFWGKLCYGLELYGGHNKNMIKQLQLLLDKAIKLVTGKQANKETLHQCKWLTVENMLRKATLQTLYKIRLGNQPEYLAGLVKHSRATVSSRIPQYETIQSPDLKSSFIPRAINEWNILPDDIRELPPNKFKKGLIKYLMKRQLESERK